MTAPDVAFFDDAASSKYYSGPSDTLGAPGRPFFVMPAEDAGMSPATEARLVTGGEVHSLAFPTDGIGYRVPTASDAMGWPHFLEGGHTAALGEGRVPDTS
ncbi:hypothetical protein AB1K54_16035 [Microbacterium sp. BWT-B31]|uniref:hypothetical protein n=1 Tax=Microbacterium sp. BWT-B31 TaxID=3232072 RepID=UPI003528BF2E